MSEAEWREAGEIIAELAARYGVLRALAEDARAALAAGDVQAAAAAVERMTTISSEIQALSRAWRAHMGIPCETGT
jgi:hypothetical protein